MDHRRLCAFGAAAALALSAAGAAFGASPASGQATGAPEHPGCFGQEAAAFGAGEMGQHASSFPEPRAGIGNVARLFGVDVQDLGFILGGGDCG